MSKLTKAAKREIIEDFADDIAKSRTDAKLPDKVSIHFRQERRSGDERPVYSIPVELLRYRKHNGRIASDLHAYENNFGKLDEWTEDTQATLKEFLENKDRPKTKELMNSIKHDGQIDPAIITCDGFLINGNRRKMALDNLYEETRDPIFQRMKVVILPGETDPGGPPTLIEIEEIEVRYQFQSDGKSEYTKFDKALSMRNKINMDMDLKTLLSMDPQYSGLPKKEFAKEVRKIEKEFLLSIISISF